MHANNKIEHEKRGGSGFESRTIVTRAAKPTTTL